MDSLIEQSISPITREEGIKRTSTDVLLSDSWPTWAVHSCLFPNRIFSLLREWVSRKVMLKLPSLRCVPSLICFNDTNFDVLGSEEARLNEDYDSLMAP